MFKEKTTKTTYIGRAAEVGNDDDGDVTGSLRQWFARVCTPCADLFERVCA